MLVNRTWQPVMGSKQALIYPYIRQPDVLSSNSYLISTPDLLVLIDPGALTSQTRDLLPVVKGLQQERQRPLLICLTHCHVDHGREAETYLRDKTLHALLAVQEQGAAILATADPRHTIAELYGLPQAAIHADVALLTAEDYAEHAPRRVQLGNHFELSLHTKALRSTTSEQAASIFSQCLALGNEDRLEIYPCPGHSPDSVSFRVGELLFIGDLLVASRPLVAGACGWDQTRLAGSLDLVSRLLEAEPITECCPGHGGTLPTPKTQELLARQRHKVMHLDAVREMNAARLTQTTDLALELIDEAEEVFSAMAGRLLYVAYHLEALEEPEEAERCRAAMDMDRIDALLQQYRDLCGALANGDILRVAFAHEALRIVESIRKRLDLEPLETILPTSLLSRANRLLLDFIAIAQGQCNLEQFGLVDLNMLLADLERTWMRSPHLDTSIKDSADDPERFLAALVLRIGHPPVGARPTVVFQPDETMPMADAAAARLCDTLVQLLEWLGLDRNQTSSVVVSAAQDAAGPLLTIRPDRGMDTMDSAHGRKKIESFARRFRLAGTEMTNNSIGFELRFCT